MSDSDIQVFLQEQIDAGLIAGAIVGIVDRTGPLSIHVAGLAAPGRKMQEDNIFWVASCSKPIVCTALMSLVDEGRLCLDDLLEDHLPIFKNMQRIVEEGAEQTVLIPNETPFTLRQCLAHVSGLPFLSRAENLCIDKLSLAEAVISYAMSPLSFIPGTAYSYGNAGINSVCKVVEQVTGLDIDSFVRERLLDPLGMHETTMWTRPEDESRLVNCFGPDETEKQLVPHKMPYVSAPFSDRSRGQHPGGCYFSTIHDMMRFCQFILNDTTINGERLLSVTACKEMWTSQTGLAEHNYGIGWALDDRGYGHGGAAGTHIHMNPESGRACVYLIQQQGELGVGRSHILPGLHQRAYGGQYQTVNTDGIIA